MPARVVIGVQWGDEGKGKIIDMLASRSDMVVRAQGGNNAGHTIKIGSETFKLSLVPSGVLYLNVDCLIAAGVVVNPKAILEEIYGLKSRGITCRRLKIDPRAHLVMPWHLALDSLAEEDLGQGKIGTTRQGVGPAYMDKAERTGLRIYDLCHPEVLAKKAPPIIARKNALLTKVYGQPPLDAKGVIDEYAEYGRQLAPYLADVSLMVGEALQANKKILFEGAQGSQLDLDFGTYPYVTSSHPASGGFCVGTGVGPTAISEVWGVAKAYATRVGTGPLPTEMTAREAQNIREMTWPHRRPRRAGWFDSVIIRQAVRVNGLTGLVLNKLDTLSGIPTLKVCTGYKAPDGSVIEQLPAVIEELEGLTPIYEEMPGFDEDVSACRSFDSLPKTCREYVLFIEQVCRCPVLMVGVGPARDQVIVRKAKGV